MAVYSSDGGNSNINVDTTSREWRNEVAYRTLLLLRTSMAVIDYPTDKIPAWDVLELSGIELEDIQRNTYLNPDVRNLMHEERSEFEESMRVPIRVSHLFKKSIHSQGIKMTINNVDNNKRDPYSSERTNVTSTRNEITFIC